MNNKEDMLPPLKIPEIAYEWVERLKFPSKSYGNGGKSRSVISDRYSLIVDMPMSHGDYEY